MEVRVWTCLSIVDNDLLVIVVDVHWSLSWMFVGRCRGCSLVVIIGAHSGCNGGDITVTCNE